MEGRHRILDRDRRRLTLLNFYKYEACTRGPDGLWYSDEDFDYKGRLKSGALPCPCQDTPQQSKLARDLHDAAARIYAASPLLEPMSMTEIMALIGAGIAIAIAVSYVLIKIWRGLWL